MLAGRELSHCGTTGAVASDDQPNGGSIDVSWAQAQPGAMGSNTLDVNDEAALEIKPVSRTSPLALFSLLFSVVGLSTLIFAGPISSLPALVGVVGGVISSYRLRSRDVGVSGRGIALTAIIVGVLAFGLSWLMILVLRSA